MDILFLGMENATRSITAEALFRAVCRTGTTVRSGGLRPAGVVHPHTLSALDRAGIDTQGLYSKALPPVSAMPEVVISLCAEEETKAFRLNPGEATVIYWEMPDPLLAGNKPEVWGAFCRTQEILLRRTAAMAALLDAEPGRDPVWLEAVLAPIASM